MWNAAPFDWIRTRPTIRARGQWIRASCAHFRAYVKERKAKPGSLLFVGDDGEASQADKLAELLRADLRAAGVDRTELHHDGENTRKMGRAQPLPAAGAVC